MGYRVTQRTLEKLVRELAQLTGKTIVLTAQAPGDGWTRYQVYERRGDSGGLWRTPYVRDICYRAGELAEVLWCVLATIRAERGEV